MTPSWSIKLHEATDEVFWAVKLNLLWLIFTLAGGVVLGIGPATVAAYAVARRHAFGETFPAWGTFASTFRREFGRGCALVVPLAGAAALLWINYFFVVGTALRLAMLGALIALTVIASYLLPMAVHFDLRATAYVPKASLFALTRPASSVLLLFVFTAVAYVSVLYPFLPLVISVGGWIQLNTWLCLRFFAENEARLRAERIS